MSSALGLGPLGLFSANPTQRFAAPAAFLGWGWLYAYCVLASRTWKQWYGIDHNGSPRQDLSKYADVAVREGKMTRKQVEQIRRVEAASANATEGFTFFAASGTFCVCGTFDYSLPPVLSGCMCLMEQGGEDVIHDPMIPALRSHRTRIPPLSLMLTTDIASSIRSHRRRAPVVVDQCLFHIYGRQAGVRSRLRLCRRRPVEPSAWRLVVDGERRLLVLAVEGRADSDSDRLIISYITTNDYQLDLEFFRRVGL